MGYDNIRLIDKLKIEKTHSTRLKSVFLSKAWKYDYSNNNFVKSDKVAYFCGNKIVFYFSIPTATANFNPYHKIKISTR